MKDKIGWFEITPDNLGPKYLNAGWDEKGPYVQNFGRYPTLEHGEKFYIPRIKCSYSDNDLNNERITMVGVVANDLGTVNNSDFIHCFDGVTHGWAAISTKAREQDLCFH
jgi:hypothetical protein